MRRNRHLLYISLSLSYCPSENLAQRRQKARVPKLPSTQAGVLVSDVTPPEVAPPPALGVVERSTIANSHINQIRLPTGEKSRASGETRPTVGQTSVQPNATG